MSNLRVLLVEGDEPRAARLISALERAHHSPVPVPDCSEALEALSIQRFDAILLSSGQSSEEIGDFVSRLRALEANQRGDTHARVFACSRNGEHMPGVDEVLPPDFDFAQLRAATEAPSPAQSDFLSVFEPAAFAEQCADETSLMVEIIDLFNAERGEQLGRMAEALAARDFDGLSRLAHTLKGSVGALHASRARQSCQAIELAAKDRDEPLCADHLETLEQNLNELAEPLAAFRARCIGS